MDTLTRLAPADVAALPWATAVEAISRAARYERSEAPPRTSIPLTRGEFLLMPAESPAAVGIKVLTVAPANPAIGEPRIQGLYLIFDERTLAPRALIDGPALTELRTAAVSASGILQLAGPAPADRLLVFGTGPQAVAHVRALREVRPPTDVVLVGRDIGGLDRAAARLSDGTAPLRCIRADDRVSLEDALRHTEVVVCATTARIPLFDGALLRDDALVVAVGSHEPVARELDSMIFARAELVLVEETATALREAGDVIMAVADGVLDISALVELGAADLPARAGLRVFKSVGMAWEDLAIATALLALR